MKTRILLLATAVALFGWSCDGESEKLEPAGCGSYSLYEENNGEREDNIQGELLLNEQSWNDFLAKLQRGVWYVDRYTLTMSDGSTKVEEQYAGADHGQTMMLLPDGTGYLFIRLKFESEGGIVTNSSPIEWSLAEEKPYTIELYSPNLENEAVHNDYITCAARTTLTLTGFNGEDFEMRGMQPHRKYTSHKTQPEECLLQGYIATNAETVEHFKRMVGSDSAECHASPEEFETFIADLTDAVWQYESYDMIYSNGDRNYDVMLDGGSHLYDMAMLSDGRALCPAEGIDVSTTLREWQWRALPEAFAIELCDPDIAGDELRNEYGQSKGITTMKLISYRDSRFVMRGLQPFSYTGGQASCGVYHEYAEIRGRVNTDPSVLDRYLSFKEQ